MQLPTNADVSLLELQCLRQEIEERRKLASTTFLFHITSVGAIFAFVLSHPDTDFLLLILPITGYLLCVRFMLYWEGMGQISKYISSELNPRLGGALGWDTWYKEQKPVLSSFFFVHPVILAFPVPSLVAIGWVVTELVIGQRHSAFVTVCVVAAILVDFVLVVGQWRLAKLLEPQIVGTYIPVLRRRKP